MDIKVKKERMETIEFNYFVDPYGRITRHKENKFMLDEEKINIYNEDIKQEWEIEV